MPWTHPASRKPLLREAPRKNLPLGVRGPYIKEVILENWISYEYARIPLKPGLNIITGPNGSGKSSIVLAIAVALGQTYTERSRRLRDLIRRGKDIARVSVVFDNRPIDGVRPIPFSRKDEVVVSRYLKSDGTYWFEMDFRVVEKAQVMHRLSRLGINPDNMLIIMHQNMVEMFSQLDPHEKLELVEEAAGLREYRRRVLEAREALESIFSEEESTRELMSRSEETLEYWRAQYEKLLRKRELQARHAQLLVELAWSKYAKQKRLVDAIRSRIEVARHAADTWALKRDRAARACEKLEAAVRGAWDKLSDAEVELAVKEKMLGRAEASGSERDVERATREAEKAKKALDRAKKLVAAAYAKLVKAEAARAAFSVRARIASREVERLERRLKEEEAALGELRAAALAAGPEVENPRPPDEVQNDIRLINVQLASLSDVSDDVEEMYLRYSKTVDEIRGKLEELERNKKVAMAELEERVKLWKRKVLSLIEDVNETFSRILAEMNAVGKVRVVDIDDVESAGLEILVGFKGSEPIPLDPFTQSGGERTVATMAFLLALQRHIKSPLRVVDEFDVHMDPINRERVFRQIVNLMKEAGGQMIFVTPGQVVGVEGDVHVLVVQSVSGSSRVSSVV